VDNDVQKRLTMTNNKYLPWFMWFLPLSFFGFQFILRLFPGLVMPAFLEKYHISATDFGFFASLYYFGYAGMQIPMALLLDKFGPRVIIGLSALLCGVATCMFVLADSWNAALVGRFLIGVGSVVGFLGTSKVISLWFPANHYARLVGLTFSFGLLGALYGGRPVSLMIEQMGWEKVSLVLGCAAIVLGVLIFAFVRNKPVTKAEKAETQHIFVSLKKLLTNRSLLILAFANFLMVGSLEGFADVWGVPYLVASRGLTTVQAASTTSFIFVGMLFGGPILAYLSEKFNAHHVVTLLCGVLMAALLGGLLVFNSSLPQFAVMLIMFLIGLLCCYQVIVFAIGAQLVSPALLSISVAFLNCINMFGGSFFHNAIGRLMDYFEPGAVVTGAQNYSVQAYTYTLALIPLTALFGAVLVWWSKKETTKALVGVRA
jgi:sugar phosphate permease